MLVFKDEYLLFSGEKCRVVNERYNFWYNGSIYPNVTQIYSRIYTFKDLADINISGQYRQVLNFMSTLAGKYNNGGDSKLWIIDYDLKDESRRDDSTPKTLVEIISRI